MCKRRYFVFIQLVYRMVLQEFSSREIALKHWLFYFFPREFLHSLMDGGILERVVIGQNLGHSPMFREQFDVAVARAVAEMRILGTIKAYAILVQIL